MITKDTRAYNRQQPFRLLARWIMIALVTGIGSAVIVALFYRAVQWLGASSPVWLPRAPFLIPLAGAVIVGALFLRAVPESGGEGIPSYLAFINEKRERLSLAATLLKFPATLITLGMYGSGGIVGPLARICAGLGTASTALLSRVFRLHDEEDIRTAAICGVSGAVSAIFHAPLGGGFFAVEVLRKDSLRYSYLFPSILTGGVSFAASHLLLGQEPIFRVVTPAFGMSGALALWLLLTAVVAGAFGMLFIVTFRWTSRTLRRVPFGQPLRAAVAALPLCAIWFVHAKWILGMSMPFFFRVTGADTASITLDGPIPAHLSIILLIVLVAKIIATSCTIGSGMSGGFTGPLIILGVGSGALMNSLSGFGVGTHASYGCIACGVSAVLAAAMNIPVAAIIITTRIFGADYSLPAIIGGILSFFVFKSRTIYEYSTIQPASTNAAPK